MPDGKQVVFVGNEPGHRNRYYLQSLDEKTPRAVTPENVNTQDWVVISPDGKFIAVTGLDGAIALQPLDGGASRPFPQLRNGFEPVRWCPDGRSLLVYQPGVMPIKLLRIDVQTGAQTTWKTWSLADRTGFNGVYFVRVSADCKSLAYSASYNPSELWIAEGFR